MIDSSGPGQMLAIIGMDAAWGESEGLEGFERLVFEGITGQPGTDSGKLSVNVDELLAKTSSRALLDANLRDALGVQKLRIATLVATNCDNGNTIQIPVVNNGPFFDLSSHPLPLVGAQELARQLLMERTADAVIFAAVYRGSVENMPLETHANIHPVFSFDRLSKSEKYGTGYGSVVWMLHDRALRERLRTYAVIRSITLIQPEQSINQKSLEIITPALDDVRFCCQKAIEDAKISPTDIGYVEACGCGIDAIDGIEIAGLVQAYRTPGQEFQSALGSIQANAGFLNTASGLAGMIRTALSLYHRTIPGIPNWSGPKLPALWRNTPFYVPCESRPWFATIAGHGRLAGVNMIGLGGACAHMVMGEVREQSARSNKYLSRGGYYLFPLAGAGVADLQNGLIDLKKSISAKENLNELALNSYSLVQKVENAPFAVSIVGHHHDEIQKEIDMALRALPDSFSNGREWQTPLGSYFTAQPAGQLGGVALVYPGAFNSYPGVGKDLFRLFPSLYQRGDRLTSDLGGVLRERILYPRSLVPMSKADIAALESRLLADPIAMLISGTALAVMYTHLLQETFDIKPFAAFGYSLGETSMMYATGVWSSHGDQAAARLEQSQAFKTRLAGPQQAIREFWNIPQSSEDSSQLLWSNYLVMAAPDKVREVIKTEPRVYMTHINAPRQVVIGGNPAACQRVISILRCSSLQAPFDYALHCDVMKSEYHELVRLHNYPVENEVQLRMYSASDYAPTAINQNEIAHKLADMLTSPLDFPRLVRQVYEDGARVFIETGAGSNCARWIDESLKDCFGGEVCPHLSLSMNRRGTDDYHTIVRMVARLFSHRVPIKLDELYVLNNQMIGQEMHRESSRMLQ